MLPALMVRPSFRTLVLALVAVAALVTAGCGESGIKIAKSNSLHDGAEIFNQRCGGCHTFDDAGTEGSAVKVNSREYKDGPNFNQRREQYQDVLYAIRNGGFSSGPMPQNIVTGRQAEIVACFVATYSGKDAANPPTPGQSTAVAPGSSNAAGAGTDNCKQQLASK
jgi:mono/diheme cytochrome c family protein